MDLLRDVRDLRVGGDGLLLGGDELGLAFARGVAGVGGLADVHLVDLLARVDQRVFQAGDLEHPEGALVERPRQRVVDEHVGAGHLEAEVHHGGTAGRHHRGLDVALRAVDAALEVDGVEDLADDVERGDDVGSADAEVDAHLLADLGLEGLVADKRADGAVEHHVRRPLVLGFHRIEVLQARLAVAARGVDLALHHVELAVDLRQSVLGLDEDQPVHAVRDVHGHRCGRAVVHVEPRV